MYVNTSAGNFEVDIIYESTVGIDENISPLTLFPNPATDVLSLKGPSLQNITVFNVLGQKIDEWIGNDSEASISTYHYENGIYFVRVNGEKTLRFVVSHW